MQPEHPEIDEDVLQQGYEIMSNYSAAFYNRTKTRPPRSVDYKNDVSTFGMVSDLKPDFVLTLFIPLSIVFLILVVVLRILRVRF